MLKERLTHFACLAHDPELDADSVELIRIELERFIAQLQGMSTEEYADWEQSLREVQMFIPGLNACFDLAA